MRSLRPLAGLAMTFFCLAAAVSAAAEPGKTAANFTFGKKTRPDPSEPQRGQTPSAPKGVRPLQPPKGSDPSKVVEPAPSEPAPVQHEPIEPAVRPELVEGPAPVPPSETILIKEEHSHPAAAGFQSHAVDLSQAVALPAHSMIVQEVWLDPQDPPRGIALQFERAEGEAGVYWEGEKEVFNPAEYEELWYYGMLPELGKWISLDILMEDLGMEDSRLAGLRFVTFDGHAIWRKTILTAAPPLEGAKQPSPASIPAPSIAAPNSEN